MKYSFSLVLLVFLLLSFVSFSAMATNSCPLFFKGSANDKSVSQYLDMHIADFEMAPKLWEETLYRPLRSFFSNILNQSNDGFGLHLIYIGAGRKTPLLNDPSIQKLINERVSRITILDVLESEAKLAQESGKKILPNIEWSKPLVLDIAGGHSSEFATYLGSLNPLKGSWPTKRDIDSHLKRGQTLDSNNVLMLAGLPKADFVYSEMVATFTGIPAIMKFVDKWQYEVNKEKDLAQRDHLQNKLDTRSNLIWQVYNDVAYSSQLIIMQGLTEKRGTIVVATDTLKVFDDPSLESLPSFTGLFPAAQGKLIEASFKPREEIWWIDEAHTGWVEEGVKSLLPHKHLVELKVYKVGP